MVGVTSKLCKGFSRRTTLNQVHLFYFWLFPHRFWDNSNPNAPTWPVFFAHLNLGHHPIHLLAMVIPPPFRVHFHIFWESWSSMMFHSNGLANWWPPKMTYKVSIIHLEPLHISTNVGKQWKTQHGYFWMLNNVENPVASAEKIIPWLGPLRCTVQQRREKWPINTPLFIATFDYPRLYQWPFQDPKMEVPTIYKAYIRPV